MVATLKNSRALRARAITRKIPIAELLAAPRCVQSRQRSADEIENSPGFIAPSDETVRKWQIAQERSAIIEGLKG